jgi:hypothetical protein
VIAPVGPLRVYVATRPVDFRKGHDGLAAVVQEMFGLDPCSGAAFVFRSKRAEDQASGLGPHRHGAGAQAAGGRQVRLAASAGATLILGAAGAAIGGSIGGSVLGVSAATIGGFVGSTIGSVVDSWAVAASVPGQRVEGPRLESLRVTSSTEGAAIPRLWGRMRLSGTIIWATDFREETRKSRQRGGGKGGRGGGSVKTTEYLYSASFAVALCEGGPVGQAVTGIGRVWADGRPMDLAGVTWRWYPGDESQEPDPLIAATMGAEAAPAYRGTAYAVFEHLPLAGFGNRLPQLSFEVFRPLADPDTAEGLVRAVTLIPASGEVTYATHPNWKTEGGTTLPENRNADTDAPDLVVALDRLHGRARERQW